MAGIRSIPICVAAAGAAFPMSAWAQSDASAIVVTGERVPRRVSETSSSVAVFSRDELEVLSGADRLDQVIALVPNLQLGSGGEGPTIRGQDSNGPLRDLPAFLGGTRPRVTLQVDGRPISYNELAFGVANLWDVARIEVFRSPQTTTQGRNAIAGAIFIETAEPTFGWTARGRVTTGSGDLRQASAMLSGPVIADALAFRASADVRRGRTASMIASLLAPQVDYNRDDYENLRLRLLATPQALPGLRLAAIASRNRSLAPQSEGVRAPFKERRDPVATYGVFRQRVDTLTLRGDYPFSPGWTAATTVTFGDAAIRRLAPSGFGEAKIAASDWTAEAVLTWRPGAAVNLLAGINLTQTSLRQAIDLRRAQLGVGEFRDRQKALGLFSQAEWRFADRFIITAGARYQRDEQDRLGALGVGGSVPLPLDYSGRFERLLPKATLAYEPRPGLRVGAMVQRAYNPGGVTLDGGRRAVNAFAAESLWAYEAFARARLLRDTVEISANAFHYDISDAQRTLTRELPTAGGTVTFVEIGNAPKARSSGGEMELSWRAAPELRVQGALGVLRTRLTRTLSPTDPLLGKEFQRSPHVTASLLAEWRPLPSLRVSGQVRHNAGYFSDDANDPERRIGPARVADARASWTRGPLTVSGYVRNLLDEFYLTYLFSASSQLATAGDPREFGASLDLRF
jgi:outer membrane receptor protein involved in Fe transport